MHGFLMIEKSRPWEFYSTTQRRLLLVVLFLVSTSNYFDYFVISVLLEPIKQEFGASDAALGLLGGLCFAVLYAVTALPIARWADRGNRRSVITVTLACWSLMTAVCGVAQSFYQLAFARFLVGAVEPGALPPAQSLITDYFPPERRASAIALMTQGGSATGWLVGIGLGGYLAAAYGWRMTFVLAGLPGLVLACLAWCVLEEPRTRLGFPSKSRRIGETRDAMRSLAKRPSYLLLVAGICTYGIFSYGLTTFLPSFMVRSLHVSMAQVGLPWGIAIAFANLGGALVGGRLADQLGMQDSRWYAWIPSLGCALAAPFYVLTVTTKHIQLFMAFDFAAEFIISTGMAPVFAAVQFVSDDKHRTLSVASALLLFSLAGSGIGPPVVGYLSDSLIPVRGSESLRGALLAVIVFLAPAAVFLFRAGKKLPRDAAGWLTA